MIKKGAAYRSPEKYIITRTAEITNNTACAAARIFSFPVFSSSRSFFAEFTSAIAGRHIITGAKKKPKSAPCCELAAIKQNIIPKYASPPSSPNHKSPYFFFKKSVI